MLLQRRPLALKPSYMSFVNFLQYSWLSFCVTSTYIIDGILYSSACYNQFYQTLPYISPHKEWERFTLIMQRRTMINLFLLLYR